MDKIVLDMLNAWYKALHVGELPPDKVKRKLITMLFVYDYLRSFYQIISDDDIRNINKILECVYRDNCLVNDKRYVRRIDIDNGELFSFDMMKMYAGSQYGLQVFEGLFIDSFNGMRDVSILNPMTTRNFADFWNIDDTSNYSMIVGYNTDSRQEIQVPANVFKLMWGFF